MPQSRKRSRKKAPAAASAMPAEFVDLGQLLAQLARGIGGKTGAAADALDRAQEIAFDAMEAEDRATRIALARKALAVSPLCSDGHLILALEEEDPEQALALCRRAVEAGAEALGKAVFEEDAGHFWGLIETRPYMRARCQLAMLLWDAGEQDEAIGHYRDMLRLNPNDNQGIRYLLVDALLAAGRDAEAGGLLNDYGKEGSAAWTWSAALLAYRRHGKGAESLKALQIALKSNRHVPDYLLGRVRRPEMLPEFIGMGDRNEAVAYVERADAAWGTKGAKDWLSAVLARGQPPRAGRPDAADEPLDPDRIDEAVLALLYLGRHDGDRAWKGFDWDAMDRLHEKGLISNPTSKAKSVVFTEEGAEAAKAACRRLFSTR
ncbi:MAG TPA: DUF6429 family protein [Allosphingosinicella sp.]|nr:DUF6429 family protein [Allosphingosinicella sp.]